MKYIVGAGVLVILLMCGGIIASGVISGIIIFISIVLLSETIKPLKWLVKAFRHLIDIGLFIYGFYLMTEGITLTIGFAVAGIMFSMFYKPYLKYAKL